MISIIIPHHLNSNQKYLDLCLRSLEKQNLEKEVIVVAGTENPPTVPEWVKLDHTVDKSPYAYKINRGVMLSNPNNNYILIAQDDLIFGKDSITRLIDVAIDYAVILNPVSNCDCGYLYHGVLSAFKDIEEFILDRFMTIDQIKGWEEAIMGMGGGPRIMFPVRYNYLYCSLLSRIAWNKIGGLDEGYINGVEDTDFCMMAEKQGIKCAITPSSFVFHFGGATTNQVKLTETDNNYKRFKDKWGWELKR